MMNTTLFTKTTDEELWAQFRVGDRCAYQRIITLHYERLFRFGTRFTKDTNLIEDCLHDLFVYLWEKRQSIGSTDSIEKYLFTSFRHRMMQELTQTQRRGWVDEEEATDLPLEQSAEELILCVETEQMTTERIREALACLPERQREALHLRYFEGMDVDRISQVMNINRQSVSNHLHKAISALRDHWAVFPA